MKKTKKHKLWFYVMLSLASVAGIIVLFCLAICFDKYGEKPYIIVPVVFGVLGLILLCLYALVQMLPFAYRHDKMKLKKRLLSHVIQQGKQTLLNNKQPNKWILLTASTQKH